MLRLKEHQKFVIMDSGRMVAIYLGIVRIAHYFVNNCLINKIFVSLCVTFTNATVYPKSSFEIYNISLVLLLNLNQSEYIIKV